MQDACAILQEPAGAAHSIAPFTSSRSPVESQIVAHYEILERLGGGGMGVVYRARDLKLDRRVALKFLPPELTRDPEARQRFAHEAKAASALQHTNICVIYDIDETPDGQMFIVMEYYDGQTLKSLIEKGPLPAEQATDIAMQIARGLASAHGNGIVHRDIKPANIMVNRDGVVKIVDFGLAKLVGEQQLTRVGSTTGTVAYMSPEQLRGDAVDGRADIWALGAVLYEMLAGRPPFEAQYEQAVIYQILNIEPKPLPAEGSGRGSELIRIIRAAMQRDPSVRFQRIEEMLAELVNTRGGPESPVARPPQATALPQGIGRISRRIRWAAAGTLLCAGLIVLGFLLLPRHERELNSIAVLPLANPQGNPEMEYLCDGISESLIQSFSRLPNLKVKSLNAVMPYKGRTVDAQTVGRELGTRAVFTGSVAQHGNVLSVNVELIDAADNSHLWGRRFEGEPSGILSFQEEITRAIPARLHMQAGADEKARMAALYSTNNEAYRLYLKGRYQWNKRSPDALLKGVALFQQALEADPSYALAYAGLADSYNLLGSIQYGVMSPGYAMPMARKSAEKALAIDGELAEAHVSLAHVKFFYDWDWAGAEKEYRRAIDLNANYATAHQWYGDYLLLRAGSDAALVEKRLALELDPTSPVIVMDAGSMMYYLRKYDSAIVQCRTALEMDETFFPAHMLLGRTYVQLRRLPDAIAEFLLVRNAAPQFSLPVALLGHAYAVAGRKQEAEKALATLQKMAKERYVAPHELAAIYLGLGNDMRAMDYLEKACQEHSGLMVYLRLEPLLDPLRGEPRFQQLVRKVGL